MKHIEHESVCLNCKETLNMATGVNHDNPLSEGCITVCSECGHVMAFDAHLKFRELTDDEVVALAGDEDLLLAQKLGKAAKMYREMHKELAPIMEERFRNIKIETCQPDKDRWFAREKDTAGPIGEGDTEDEAARNLFMQIMTEKIDEVTERIKREAASPMANRSN